MISPRKDLAYQIRQWLAGLEFAGRPVLLDVEPTPAYPSESSEVSIRVYADETERHELSASVLTDRLEVAVITPFEDWEIAEDLLDAVRYPLQLALNHSPHFETPTATRALYDGRFQCWKLRTAATFHKEETA